MDALPQSAGQVSANWKALVQRIPSKATAKTASKPGEEIWFDHVDPIFLDPSNGCSDDEEKPEIALVTPKSYTGKTKAVAMDCEMVGVGTLGRDSIVARVSVVNQCGHRLYDKYVAPTEKVTDYRTAVSGIRPKDLQKGESFKVVQREISELIKGRILVGHAVHNDLKVLYLDHPRRSTRDTAKYKPFRKLFHGGTPSLKRLAEKLLGIKIQEGEHDSVQDAQVAMRLYTLRKVEWEGDLKTRPKHKPNNVCRDNK